MLAFDKALCLVEAGLGITVVSSTCAMLFHGRLCFRQFDDFKPNLPVYAVRADGVPVPPLNKFIELFKHNLRQAHRIDIMRRYQ